MSAAVGKIIAEVRALSPEERQQLLEVPERETLGSEQSRRDTLSNSIRGIAARKAEEVALEDRRPGIARAQTVLGWSPTVPLREGLRRTIDEFAQRWRSGKPRRQRNLCELSATLRLLVCGAGGGQEKAFAEGLLSVVSALIWLGGQPSGT